MQRMQLARIVIVSLHLAGPSAAKSPIGHMNGMTLGAEYSALWRGQTITEAKVMSREVAQFGRLSYAPLEYIQLTAGLGGARFGVDEYKERKFEGGYGLAPMVGLGVYTPAFVTERYGSARRWSISVSTVKTTTATNTAARSSAQKQG